MSIVEDHVDRSKLEIPDAFRKGGYQGYKIFLDRYTDKAPKGQLKDGDLVLVVTKRDPKFPQKEIGWIREVNGKGAIVDLATGGQVYEEFDLISKPLELHPKDVSKRVASFLASCETYSDGVDAEKEFEEILFDYFIPGGRILAGAGIDGLTMNNCYVLPSPKDSRHGIMERAAEMVETHSRGGGVGLNLSSLRPRYSKVVGVNGISSGAVSWGKVYDLCTGLIEQGGSRRGATMLMLNDWHPDVLEFIEVKQEAGEIENANMSVCVSDDFMEVLESGNSWDLIFPDTTDPDYDTHWDGNIERWRDELGKAVVVYDTIDPKEIWDRIIYAAWNSAEPGLHFLQRSNKMSNSWYFTDLVATNPCGEQILEAYGVCTLGAIDLSKMVTDDEFERTINWERLHHTVRFGVRMLDNVITLENYHFDEIRNNHQSNRRIGLGTMGLADLLVQLGIRYGSDESVELIDELYGFITQEAYHTSVDLATLKGTFPKFEPEKFLQSNFMEEMPDSIRERVRHYGIRNVCLITQAPTGTTGTMVGTSTGIEPFFNWQYSRQSRLGIHVETVPVINELGLDVDDLPDYCVTAQDLTPEEHLNVQAAIQRWVDSSISKTTNCPSSYTVEQTDELYRKAYHMGCKGITIYRDQSRDQQVLSNIPAEKDEREELEDGVELIHSAGCVISADGTYSKCDL